jgi:hypothetical protein
MNAIIYITDIQEVVDIHKKTIAISGGGVAFPENVAFPATVRSLSNICFPAATHFCAN